MAIGILVVPTDMFEITSETPGNTYPMAMPIPMAMKIHRVKFRSKKLSFFIGAIFADIGGV
jgi:hypothetical protein